MVSEQSKTEITELATTPTEVVARSGKKFKISGAVVRECIRDLPPEPQDLIWWFSQYCHRHNLSRAEIGKLLKKPNGEYYSGDSIAQLLGGGRIRRGENIDLILDAIRSFRKVEQAREEQVNSGFIETRLFFELERRFLNALKRQRILFVIGDSQIGKSTCLQEIQRRHNHGQTIYVEVPAGGTLSKFLRELASKLNIPVSGSTTALAEEIIKSFDSRMMLIVDEAHRCLCRSSNAGASNVFDFIRELYNKARCGIVISMTNEGRDELLNGRNAKSYEQIWRRRITPLQLPPVTPRDDLDLFSSAFGLPPANDKPVTISVTYYDEEGNEQSKKYTDNPLRLQTDTNRNEGLGVWIAILQDAADMAAEQGRPITWGAVLKAHAQAQADAEIFQ